MEITVLGAGNTGYAISAHMAHLGHNVTLYTRSKEKAAAFQNRELEAEGILQGSYKICVTDDLKTSISNADYIFITTRANAHFEILSKAKEFLKDKQKLIILNGNWGAFEAASVLEDEIKTKGVVVGESAAMPYIATAMTETKVQIRAIKEQTVISLVQGADPDIEKLYQELSTLFKGLTIVDDILETTLSATNPVIHAPIALMNLTRIELSEDYMFYGSSCTAKCVDYVEAIDRERVRIAKALGVNIMGVLEAINSFWTDKHDNLYDALHKNVTYQKAKGPNSLDHRYITEDLPFGIVPISTIGKLLGISTPYTDALITEAGLYMNHDFYEDSISFSLDALKKHIK